MSSVPKKIIVIGGGTYNYVRAHLALAAPAFGESAKQIAELTKVHCPLLTTELVLTKMADSQSMIITNNDLETHIDQLIKDNTIKCIIFNAAVCDFEGQVGDVHSSKYAERLHTSDGSQLMHLTPSEKIIGNIRKYRKDIFVVGFKTTNNKTPEQQFAQGLSMLKRNSINLVIANDLVTRNNMLITPEEGVYNYGVDRKTCLLEMVQMMNYRTHLSFTRSTVLSGSPVSWNDQRVYSCLHHVINWCIQMGAYKPFNGVTTGHFAAKLSDTEFLTSIRKTNFNKINDVGLVYVKSDGPDSVIAYGAKPSVGGQSQRIVFNTFKHLDCIVHFHCPLRSDAIDTIPVVSQFEYECGSHECGQNTASGLKHIRDGIYAVMLDNHGPNIVFNHEIDPQSVIQFISDNFDLEKSSSGFEQVYFK